MTLHADGLITIAYSDFLPDSPIHTREVADIDGPKGTRGEQGVASRQLA